MPLLLVIDECQYLKDSLPGNEVYSLFQGVIDPLREDVNLVLCGSYVIEFRLQFERWPSSSMP